MKITYLPVVILALGMLFSCQKENLPISVNKKLDNESINVISKNNDIFRVNPEEAKEYIEKFLNNSELRAIGNSNREIEGIYELSNLSEFRSTSPLFKKTDSSFYIAQFKDKKGFAFVSKDKRTFPIFAVLDKGNFSDKIFRNKVKRRYLKNLLKGYDKEIKAFDNKIKQEQLRSSQGRDENEAIYQFISEGFKITRSTPNRLDINGPIFWEQELFRPLLYLKKEGALNWEVYPDRFPKPKPDSTKKVIDNINDSYEDSNDYYYDDYYEDQDDYYDDMYDDYDDYRAVINAIKDLRVIPKKDVRLFGCTPVAYGQVMYALRNCEGFDDLCYDNGDYVRWDEMAPNSFTYSSNGLPVETPEVHRFLGWITENVNPRYTKSGTIVFNTNAKDFFRRVFGTYVESRYDNCIPPEDWNGYGWSEDKKVAEEFFNNPNCYIIMTADGSKFSFYYHTFVIDGMIEFQKKLQVLGMDITLIKHLYHVNAGWGENGNGYFLYVENHNDQELEYYGPKGYREGYMDYRSKASYFVIKPF